MIFITSKMSGYSTFGSLYDTDVLYGITPDGDGTCIQDRDVILFQTSELDMQDKKRIVKRPVFKMNK